MKINEIQGEPSKLDTKNMLTTREEVEEYLTKLGIKNYVLDGNLKVDVESSVNLSNKPIGKLRVQFGVIKGSFLIFNSKLSSLVGSPHEVYGNFDCGNNMIKVLDVGHDILTVHESFRCEKNPIEMVNLSVVCKSFMCYNTHMKDLTGLKVRATDEVVIWDLLDKLSGIDEHILSCKRLDVGFDKQNISHLMSAVMIENLEQLLTNNEQVDEILSKHLPIKNNAGLLDLQEDLMEAGFDEAAER